MHNAKLYEITPNSLLSFHAWYADRYGPADSHSSHNGRLQEERVQVESSAVLALAQFAVLSVAHQGYEE